MTEYRIHPAASMGSDGRGAVDFTRPVRVFVIVGKSERAAPVSLSDQDALGLAASLIGCVARRQRAVGE